jgi:hypothetical protein
MLYPQAQQLSLDIFFVGTVLAGLTKGESEQLYLALNQVSPFSYLLSLFVLMHPIMF